MEVCIENVDVDIFLLDFNSIFFFYIIYCMGDELKELFIVDYILVLF